MCIKYFWLVLYPPCLCIIDFLTRKLAHSKIDHFEELFYSLIVQSSFNSLVPLILLYENCYFVPFNEFCHIFHRLNRVRKVFTAANCFTIVNHTCLLINLYCFFIYSTCVWFVVILIKINFKTFTYSMSWKMSHDYKEEL